MTNLLTLATQIEQATEEQQREMLLEAMKVLKPQWWTLNKPVEEIIDYTRWCTMLDAEAYESAAIMLVPDGYDWDIGTERNRDLDASAWLNKGDNFSEEIFAETPALALAAACLRAKTQESE